MALAGAADVTHGAGVHHRIVEIEFYGTWDAQVHFVGGNRFERQWEGHNDPFTHRHIEQAAPGRFYFHRSGPTLRTGTYKGLDITFKPNWIGPALSFCGILIRSLRAPDGTLIEGSCTCVNTLLATANMGLHQFVGVNGGRVDDPANLLQIVHVGRNVPIIRSPRVGLTMKRAGVDVATLHIDYIMKAYRYHTTAALKKNACLIALTIGDPKPEYVAAHRRGLDLTYDQARQLDTSRVADLCALLGYCEANIEDL